MELRDGVTSQALIMLDQQNLTMKNVYHKCHIVIRAISSSMDKILIFLQKLSNQVLSIKEPAIQQTQCYRLGVGV